MNKVVPNTIKVLMKLHGKVTQNIVRKNVLTSYEDNHQFKAIC